MYTIIQIWILVEVLSNDVSMVFFQDQTKVIKTEVGKSKLELDQLQNFMIT